MASPSTTASRAPTVVSCPGKVFLAGGYLVLDRAHQGYVVATPSRFFTVVSEAQAQQGEQGAAAGGDRFAIEVVSPQFDDGRWRYEARSEDGEWTVDEDKSQGCVCRSLPRARALPRAGLEGSHPLVVSSRSSELTRLPAPLQVRLELVRAPVGARGAPSRERAQPVGLVPPARGHHRRLERLLLAVAHRASPSRSALPRER